MFFILRRIRTPDDMTRLLMDQFSMMIQAAIAGLSIALLPDYRARTEIDEGRLIPLLRPSMPGTGSYWLAWPDVKDRYAPLAAFRTWISVSENG